MARRKTTTSYDGGPVGYKKPPAEHQFKKGGKKPLGSGRKAGVKKSTTIIEELLNEPVTITENGIPRTMSKLELLLRSCFEKAIRSPSINQSAALIRLLEKLAASSVDPPEPIVIHTIPGDF